MLSVRKKLFGLSIHRWEERLFVVENIHVKKYLYIMENGAERLPNFASIYFGTNVVCQRALNCPSK
jgi:hypothetical protein